jgi:hypothetical protein
MSPVFPRVIEATLSRLLSRFPRENRFCLCLLLRRERENISLSLFIGQAFHSRTSFDHIPASPPGLLSGLYQSTAFFPYRVNSPTLPPAFPPGKAHSSPLTPRHGLFLTFPASRPLPTNFFSTAPAFLWPPFHPLFPSPAPFPQAFQAFHPFDAITSIKERR